MTGWPTLEPPSLRGLTEHEWNRVRQHMPETLPTDDDELFDVTYRAMVRVFGQALSRGTARELLAATAEEMYVEGDRG